LFLGVVFASESNESKKIYATKVEIARSKSPKLEREYKIGKLFENNEGFTEIRYFWTNKTYNALVMEVSFFNFCSILFFFKDAWRVVGRFTYTL
jgi:hypothetical protein